MRESQRCLECGCRDYFECQLIKYIQEYGISTDKDKEVECHDRRQEIDAHPYIERNPDKCVLCGLCIRACDEIVGSTAIGLVGRGFASVIKPEFELPLNQTDCIACGQCTDVCPTGACMEKQAAAKQVPVAADKVSSVCGFCGVGCKINVEYKGDVLFRATPDKTNDDGLLCQRGKFGLDYVNAGSRLVEPTVRRNGQMVPVDWAEAELEVVKRLQAIVAAHGRDSVGIVVSPRLTNEELFAAGKLAEALQTSVKTSYTVNGGSGLEEVFGYDASTNGYAEIANCDYVLTVGKIRENHPVLDFKIRLAGVTHEEWPESLAMLADLKGFSKALLELGAVDESRVTAIANGYPEFKASLADVDISDTVSKLAQNYQQAKRPLLVIDEDSISREAVKLLAYAALLTGKIGAPYRGIIIARRKNNSQGAVDMGFTQPIDTVEAAVADDKIKALVIFGENPASYPENMVGLKKLSFLAVYDIFPTATTAAADVVVPLVSGVETDGTYTSSDRQIQTVRAALAPKTGRSNLQVLLAVLDRLGISYDNLAAVKDGIAREVPNYRGIKAAASADNLYWPSTADNDKGVNVLYSAGFATKDGKAVLAAVNTGRIFKTKDKYDTVELYSVNKQKELLSR